MYVCVYRYGWRQRYHPKNFRPSYLMVLPEHPHSKHYLRNIVRAAYTLRKGYGTTHIGIVELTDNNHPNLTDRQKADNAGFFKMYVCPTFPCIRLCFCLPWATRCYFLCLC